MADILIIGSGRTAKHFAHYFQLLALNFETWNRTEALSLLRTRLEKASHILLLISDSALAGFYQENLKHLDQPVIHFSGALEIDGMSSAHPLMTFTNELYDLPRYLEIPFITTTTENIIDLIPGLANPCYRILPEQKPYYHSLCVVSGNFTVLLWQKMASSIENLGLPSQIALPYMKQVFSNLEINLASAATGPLAKRDLTTVQRNLQALEGDPFQKIYRAFVEVYFSEALSKEHPHKGIQ